MRRTLPAAGGRPVRSRGRSSPPASADDGFTLLEMIVAVALIGMVGAFAIRFQVSSLSVTREQADREVAAQLASEALDSDRAIGGSALLSAPPPNRTVTVNGITFTQTQSVTTCRQVSPGGPCTSNPPAPGVAELARVVVTVQWSAAGYPRSEKAAGLISAAAYEPAFTT
jgi:prepilin-type N-terminal cleavage/methylation domain-containing protein